MHFQLGLLGRLALQLSPGQRSRVEFIARVCTVYATKVLLISVTPFDFFLFNISLINATLKCFVSGLLVVILFSWRRGRSAVQSGYGPGGFALQIYFVEP